jgi:flagellar biosynthesis anti-sigma factor FlgM
MKVTGSDGYSAIRGLLRRAQGADDLQRPASPGAPAGQRGEKVVISAEAREIQHLKAIVEAIPDVRDRKVEEIRQLIRDGRYHVELDKVSDRILRSLVLGDL